MTIDDDGDDGENNGDGDDIDDTSNAANAFCSCSTLQGWHHIRMSYHYDFYCFLAEFF